jgi:predicted Zn-dependent protease DUF2268
LDMLDCANAFGNAGSSWISLTSCLQPETPDANGTRHILKRTMIALAGVCLLSSGTAHAGSRPGPVFETSDVDRFYQVYDSARGHPSAEQLQHDYIDKGSEGLHSFFKARNTTAQRIADAISLHPEIYVNARRCLAWLPLVHKGLQKAMANLADLYPGARFPAITIAVGRGKPLAIGDPANGVRVGLEALCASDEANPGWFVHMISHEYAHVQQSAYLNDESHPTVLQTALAEGGAEFVAELISGAAASTKLMIQTKGRELEIESAFVPDEDKTDLSKWFYNHPGTAAWPPDLGYWVGYRIVKSYYRHARDKRRALRDIFAISNARDFLAKSGWRPGMRFEPPARGNAQRTGRR